MKAEGGRPVSSVVPQVSVFSPWPHRIALILTCATFPLLFIGGLVTSKGAGLAVPDWPTTFGYNMFLYPWSKMVGNIFYEHSHRLVASFVGFLTIALVLTFWLRERRGWLRWLGVGALGLVIVQGVMGGLRVVLLEDTLAIVHAATAQAFFALTVALAVFTSTGWQNFSATQPVDGRRPNAPSLCRDHRLDLSASDLWRGFTSYRRTVGCSSRIRGLGGAACCPHSYTRDAPTLGSPDADAPGVAVVRVIAVTTGAGYFVLCGQVYGAA